MKRTPPNPGTPTAMTLPPARETKNRSRNGNGMAKRTRWRIWLVKARRYVLSLHGSPEQIALGTAIGIFVAFTPTIGFQIIIAAFLATLLNANRTAAIIAVWITNPFTLAPIYAFTYLVGIQFWPGPEQPVGEVYNILKGLVVRLMRFEAWALLDQFRTLLRLGKDMLVPMTIGGCVVGFIAGVITYYPTRWFARRAQPISKRIIQKSKEKLHIGTPSE